MNKHKTVVDAVNELRGINQSMLIGHHKWSFYWPDGGTSSTGFSFNDKFVCTFDEFNQCVKEMSEAKWMVKSKPVYTQAMADKGVMPSVGMECLAFHIESSNTCPVTYLGGGKEKVIVLDCGAEDVLDLRVWSFKPLAPPIELIDKGVYLFDVQNKKQMVGEAYFTDVTNEWMINSLRTNASYEAVKCTNIKLLTPEGE